MAAMRIVSLLPAATEIVATLGLLDDLVGVTFECDEPPGVRDGRAILVDGLDVEGLSAAEIDEMVGRLAASGEPMYRLDVDAFRSLDPDLVLTQDLCRVCALPSGDVDAALDHLGCRAAVVSLDPMRLDDVLAAIVAVADAAGVPDRGRSVVAGLQQRLDTVANAVAACDRHAVFVLEWSDPPFVAGHWIPDLVAAAGAEPVLSRGGQRSTTTSWDEIEVAAPDTVVVAPCGFGLDDAAAQAASVIDHLPAGAAVWAIDANACVVRPGPRLVEAVEAFAAMFHGLGAVDPKIARRIR
jgi:iron complex transport system substrate-binding protein